MAVVGSAEIIVRAITTKVKADIQKAFADARPAIQAEGRKAAKDFAGAFSQSLEQSLGPQMRRSFSNAASGAADAAGATLRRELPDEVGGAAQQAGDAAERELTAAGNRGGNGFLRGFLSSGFASAAEAASSRLTMLYASTNILGPAIAGLVGALSSLVSGLFAIASAASQAAGALAVLPGLYAMFAQVGAAVKLGFGGVAEAVQAGAKAQDTAAAAATNAGKAAAAAGEKAKAGAGKQLAAAKALAAAQERLKIAQEESRKAQEALNKANEKASDGAEEQAAAQRLVATAAQKKNEVLADPNASAEQGAAAQQGLDAAQAAADAIKRQQEEQEKAARRAAERADAARRKELAAQAAVNKAQKGNDAAGKAVSAGGIQTPAIKAANLYQQALEQLSPAAAAFVEQLLKMRERVKELRDAIANEMFPPLTEALKLLDNDALWNILEENLSETGRLFGEAGLSLAKLIDTDTARSGIDKWMKANNDILTVFTGKTAESDSALDSLARIIGKVALAIQPITKRFAEWIAGVIKAKDATLEVGDATSGMTGFFERAGDRAAQLGRIIGNVVGAIGNLAGAATPAGDSLIDSFEKATARFERFTEKIAGDGTAEGYFRGVARNFRQISRTIALLTRELVELGDNEGIGNLAKSIRPAIRSFGDMADKLTSGEVGTALGNLVSQVAEFMDKLTDSGATTIFLNTLGDIVGTVNNLIDAIAKIPGAKTFFGFVVAIAAMNRAFSFAGKIAGFFAKAILGGPIKALKLLFGFGKKKVPVPAVPTGGAGAAAAGAAGSAAGGATTLISGGAGGLNAASTTTTRSTGKMGKAFGAVGGAARKAGGAFKSMGKGVLGLAGGPIGLLITLLPLIVKGFKTLMARSPAFRAFIGGLVKGFKDLIAKIMPVIKVVGQYVVKAFQFLFTKINAWMPTIKRVVGDVFSAIGSFVKKYIVPAWNNILLPALRKLFAVVKATMPVVKKIFQALFSAIKFYITKIFIPIWKVIFSLIRGFFSIVKRVFGAVKVIVSGVFKAISFIWKNVLAPVFRAIGRAIGVMGTVFRTVFGKIKDIFNGFKTAFGRVWDFIKGIVDKIKNAFGTVKDSISNAFSNLGSSVRGGLNTFIGFLNDKLIRPLNSVTSKFGLDIPDIKTFAQGGKVTGPGTATSDSIAARLSNGEFVVKTQAAKALGYKNLEHMNKTGQMPAGTTDGVGGLIGWAKDAITGGAAAIAEGADYIGKKGAGKVLSALVDVARSAVNGLGLAGGSFIKDFAMGILEKLSEAAENWGGDKGKTPPPSVYGPYANTAGLPNIQGWSYPLAARFGITQYPNQGHSPSWAVDIGSPDGVPVLSVAAGVVKYFRDWDPGSSYGKYIEVAHADGTTSLYAHLEAVLIKLGQRIAAGQVIGRSGHSGGVRSSTGGNGAHLHFELKPGADTRAMMRLRGVALAKGGVARATSGGVPAIIAEAGRDERVEPLDNQGMSKRDRAILAAVASAAGGKGGLVVNVNNPEPERASTSVAKAIRGRSIASGWSI